MTSKSNSHSAIKCFVIGPIGDRLAPADSPPRVVYEQAVQVFEEIIEPACRPFGIKPIRADRMTKAGEIPEQIVRLLGTADLVVADLTEANPNVMYELGLRHATGLPAIQIGEHGRLPFDVSTIRTIQFTRSENGLIQARQQLHAMLATGIAEGFDQVTASRVLKSLGRTPVTDHAVDVEALVEEESPGFLEVIAEMEDAYPRLTGKLEEIGGVIQQMGNLAIRGSEEFKSAEMAGNVTGKDRLLLVRRFAESLDKPAGELEGLAAAYEDEMARVDRGISYIIGRLEAEPELVAEAGDLPETIASLAVTATDGLGSIEGLGGTIADLGSADRGLRVRTNRIATALNRIVSSSAPIFTWDRRLQRVGGVHRVRKTEVGTLSPAAKKQQRPRRRRSQPTKPR